MLFHPIVFPAVATLVAGAITAVAARLRDPRWLFFGVMFSGVAVGAWLHHFTRLPGFWIAPAVIVALYLMPLARIRLTAALVGGVTVGLLLDELWLALAVA